jgi:putative membrane protein
MNAYLAFKALHLIAVISWMAGLLYLPRIFVYHVNAQNSETIEKFKTMERRLFFIIMNPAMILSWIFGILLIHQIGFASLAFLWVKLKFALVILMTIFHFYLLACLKNFNNNSNNHSERFYRIINEVPTALLILIIFIVVFKPL